MFGLPHARPMPDIGPGCHELRIIDRDQTWRIVYHIAADAIVILEVFSKKTAAIPKAVIAASRRRLQMFLALSAGKKDVDAKRQA
jgi:phage-related protein